MRALLAVLLASTALPVAADTLTATSRIVAVTVYPDGARVTREVTFTAPTPGAHELLVTDLPAMSEARLMRLSPAEGLSLGAFTLRADRLPPREPPLSAAQTSAKAEVERLEAEVETARLAHDRIAARVEAAEAELRFLASFAGALPDGATPETIRAMAATVGSGTLAAREAALAAGAELFAARKVLEKAETALAEAQAAFDALPAADQDYAALAVAVTAAAAGDQRLSITQIVDGASWRPVYEFNLSRSGTAALALDRSVLVSQYTGEDWSGVELTLSSSRPADQSAPSALWPDLRRVGPRVVPDDLARLAEDGMVAYGAAPESEPVAAPVVVAEAAMAGDTVVYDYPEPVTIASGAEDLRLMLDRLDFAPVVQAVAVPRLDRTAFVVASFTNGTGEPLLPGEAMLYREGVLVGSTFLDTIAPGAETDLGFGPLETLRVTREMPKRAEGETGIFTASNQMVESAILSIENTGDEAWPVRILDRATYSEQEALEVEVSASPAPSETDVDGQRGILAWDFDLAAGGKTSITLEQTLTWPEGMELQ